MTFDGIDNKLLILRVYSPDCLNLEKKWLPRASVKELQQEDSDTVWNELSHCKTQNRALQTKR